MANVIRYVDPDATGSGTGLDWTNAYTSLNTWETAEQTDLVTDGDTHTVYCRASGDSPDTTEVRIYGWTTGASNDITVIVGVNDRHTGTGDTGYRIIVSVNAAVFRISEDYVSVYGLAVKNSGVFNTSDGLSITSVGSGLRIYDSCLAYECGASGVYSAGYAGTHIYANCISLSNGQGSKGGNGFRLEYSGYAYNCVALNNINGSDNDGDGFQIDGSGYTLECKNCYSGGNAGYDYVADVGTLNTTTCHDSDGTGDTTTTLSTSAGTYFENVTSGSEDVNIKADSELIDVATDLSSDTYYPFDWDIYETTRESSNWDVGAVEYILEEETTYATMQMGCNT